MNQLKLPFLLVLSLFFIAGCGGSGGGSSDLSTTDTLESGLSALTLSSGTLDTTFSSGTLSYNTSVAHTTDSIAVTPTATDANALITVNGILVGSGAASQDVNLAVGDNTISIVVTAADGSKMTYNVTVTRLGASTDASLSNLTLSNGVLTPAFATGTLSYTASVTNDIAMINVTPTATDANATITVNGTAVNSGTASQPIALAVGDTTVTIMVTAEDTAITQTYTITVARGDGGTLPSTVSTLSGLSLSSGTLAPAFATGTLTYTASVEYPTDSITIRPTATDTKAIITVNGTAVASGSDQAVSLNVGSNPVSIVVTAEDGTTASNYTITITRAAASNDSSLSGLLLSDGSLNPAFATGTLIYTASVDNSTDLITVTPAVTDSNATITINGTAVVSGSSSQAIDLPVGDTTVTIVVTAEDTTQTTYSVTITRAAASTDASLSGLALSSGMLNPTFNSGTLTYTASVTNDIATINVTPTATDTNATLTVNGSAVDSGVISQAISLDIGPNVISIVVTAEDTSTTTTYSVTVTREGSSDATLSGLTVSDIALDQIFQSTLDDYTGSAGFLLTSITVTPTATDANATITINGTEVDSGSESGAISLAEGDNVITIEVTAEDTISTQIYTITITRADVQALAEQAYLKASNPNKDDQFGMSVAIEGDTLVVGAPFEDTDTGSPKEAGAVYVYTRSNNVWSEAAIVRPDTPVQMGNFGWTVALQGNTLVVGAPQVMSYANGQKDNPGPGAVYVFTGSGASWTQQAILQASNPDIDDQFGWSVALDGDTLIVGATGEAGKGLDEADNSTTGAGAAYVFTLDSGSGMWSQQAYLKADTPTISASFGYSVALEGDTVMIGAPETNEVSVFTLSSQAWETQQVLQGSNTDAGDSFGASVAIDGNLLAVGAIEEASDGSDETDNSLTAAGATYVFARDSGSGMWSQQAYLKAEAPVVNSNFGSSLAIAGDTLLVGADAGLAGDTAPGEVYVFTYDGTGTWSQATFVTASNAVASHRFGHSVAMDGDTAVVGDPLEDGANNGQQDTGAAYVLQ